LAELSPITQRTASMMFDDQRATAFAVGRQHQADLRQVTGEYGGEQLLEQHQVFAHGRLALIQRQVIRAVHRRLQVLDGFLQVRVVGEGVRGAHHVEAFFDEGADVLALEIGHQALLDLHERRHVGLGLPALGDRIAEQDVQLAHQRAQALHLVRGEFGDVGATARQDRDQVPAFKDQQGFAHGAAADIECQRDLLFLDALPRLEIAANDTFGEVVSNLLGEAVRRLERHGCPSNSSICTSGAV
jgi:hypothetical protein